MNDGTAPLVSVVIPTYNYGRYLGRALQSVLDQAYTKWEVIVIDNHSTDNTDEVMASYSDSRITYLKIHNNGVIAASRNAGIRVAKGEWIAFLDSDDWWTSNKLSVCVSVANCGADVVYHEFEIIGGGKFFGMKRLIGSWQVRPPIQIDLLTRGNALVTSSVVVRRDILDKLSGFDESSTMVASEDYNLWLKLAGVTERFIFCHDVMGFYSVHDKGMSNKDMSSSAKCATDPFRNILSHSQQKYLDSKIEYLHLRHLYLNGNFVAVKLPLVRRTFNGPWLIRAKSLYMYFVSLLKSGQLR